MGVEGGRLQCLCRWERAEHGYLLTSIARGARERLKTQELEELQDTVIDRAA